jgi:hypothetical protein
MKPEILQAAILEILAEREAPAPERYVMLVLSVEFRITPTFTELRETLKGLEEAKYIAGIRSQDGLVVWSVCDFGRARVAELRLKS